MNYKKIFSDKVVENNGEGNRFYKVTVYEPENSFPFLFQVETGDKRMDDWEKTYFVEQFYYNGSAQAIRKAITLIDNYKFEKERVEVL